MLPDGERTAGGPKADLRPFGATGLEVSALGLGTSHIASLTNPRGPTEMARLLDAAYDQGVRFYDTADVYGQGDAERLLAPIAGKPGTVICTKAGLGVGRAQSFVRSVKPLLRPLVARSTGLRSKTSATRQAQERHILDPTILKGRLLASLKRLKMDCVDVFLLHSPPIDALSSGRLYDFLDEIREQELAKVVGVSVQTLEDAATVIADRRVAAIQVPLASDRLRAANPTLRDAAEAGIGLIAREVLTGATDPNVALAAMLSEPLLPVSLVGTTNARHLDANIALMKQVNYAS